MNIIGACVDVPTVCIPADNALKLTVSFHPTPPSAGPVQQLASQSQSSGIVVVSESVPVPPVIRWLMEAAKMRDGYTAFKQGQHHVQTNVDVIASWWFAILFSEWYSQTVSPVQVYDGHHRKRPKLIKKSEVQRALGVGATWMSKAAQAVALLCKYGEHGSSPRPHVVDMCTNQMTKTGARALLSKLREEDQE